MKSKSLWMAFGLGLMLLLASLNYCLLRNSLDTFFVMKSHVAFFPQVKISILPLTILLGLFLLPFCRGGRIGRVFSLFFPINAVIMGVFALVLSWQNSVGEGLVKMIYVWSHASMALIFPLIWGFGNQRFSFKMAAILYPILGLIFPNIGGLIGEVVIKQLSGSESVFIIAFGCASAMSLLIYGLYVLFGRQSDQKEEGRPQTWGYWAALVFLLYGVKFAAQFPKLAFKLQLKNLFPDPPSYVQVMGKFAQLSGTISMGMGVIGVCFGILLFYRGREGLSKLLGGIGVGMLAFGCLPFFLQGGGSMWGVGLFSGLMGIFILFRELAFLAIPLNYRLMAKISIDIIFVTLLGIINTPASILSIMYPSLNIAFFALGMVATLLSVLCIRKGCRG